MSCNSSHLTHRFVKAGPIFERDAAAPTAWGSREPVGERPSEREDEVDEDALEESYLYVENDAEDDPISFQDARTSLTAGDREPRTVNTTRTESQQAAYMVLNLEQGSLKWNALTSQKPEPYKERYDNLKSTWGVEFCSPERFAELCKATEGWTRDELGDLIVEGKAIHDLEDLGWTSEDQDLSAGEYAYYLRGVLQDQREWFRGTLLSEDGIRYFMPPGFAYTRSDAFKSISQRHEQAGSGTQESQVDRC